jgi:hypothetical protein
MSHPVRPVLVLAAAACALLVGPARAAAAAEPGHQPYGTGSGLSGGPTDAQVAPGAPAAPLADPTLGEGTVLPPVYNAVGGATGG